MINRGGPKRANGPDAQQDSDKVIRHMHQNEQAPPTPPTQTMLHAPRELEGEGVSKDMLVSACLCLPLTPLTEDFMVHTA